jgi:hypothetical protein
MLAAAQLVLSTNSLTERTAAAQQVAAKPADLQLQQTGNHAPAAAELFCNESDNLRNYLTQTAGAGR